MLHYNLMTPRWCALELRATGAHHSIGTADEGEKEDAVVQIDVDVQPETAAGSVEGALK